MTNLNSILKAETLIADKDRSSQSFGFSSGHVWMWELEYKENWAPKNWCFQTMVLEKTLESPLDCKEIQPVHPKGNQSGIFIVRTDVEAETPILRSPDEKNWLTGKDPDAGKDWRQEEKGTTEDEMFGWHHWLDGHEFEWFLGVGDGQGSLECCSPWVANSWTRLSNWIELNWTANAGDPRDVGSIPGLKRSPGAGNGNLFQYSCLENSMDRGGWQAIVHGVAKS